ncbi:hypothetical protein [Streptomyces sp. NPDC048720]|uniref:hypothetical protein n=1 Tax=Streptomyces sp. NPDC048720 TaxID=3365588 RepID=UPI003722956C
MVAPGRNQAALDLLADRFGPLVRPVPLTGDEAGDRAAMCAAADGPIDMVIDLLPPSAPSSAARTAAMTVREQGRVVLMGGVGMLGGDDLALPYPWIMRNSITVRGQWMYPRTANVGIIRLLTSGTLELAPERVRSFGLDAVNDAVSYAASHGGPFDRTALIPGGSLRRYGRSSPAKRPENLEPGQAGARHAHVRYSPVSCSERS